MPQKMIKVDYPNENCNGIYYVGNSIPNDTGRGTYKFIIRQTITIEGVGKKTSKETFTKHGMTFYKALKSVIAEREPMKDRILQKALGVVDNVEEMNMINSLTVNQLWDHYKAAKADSWSLSYTSSIQSDYKRLLKDEIGDMKAIQVKRKHIEDIIEDVRKAGYKERSQHSVITLVKGMYKWWLDREELEKRNPANITLKKLDNARSVTLTWSEIEKLYLTMYSYKHERYRQLFIWLSTGRRLGETLKLRKEHLDEGYYTIIASNNKAKQDMIYRIPEGVTIPRVGEFVFQSPRNRSKQLQGFSVHGHWDNIRDAAGLPTIRKHDLRHVITTKLKEGGVPSEIRAMVIGHVSSEMVDRYSTDTEEGAELKHKAVTFFLAKVFNKIDRTELWDNYIRNDKA